MLRATLESYLPPTLEFTLIRLMKEAYYNAIGEEDTFIVDQDYVLNLGLIHGAVLTFEPDFHDAAQTFTWDWICSGHADQTDLGRALAPDSPYLGDTVMAAALGQLYSVRMQFWDGLNSGFREGFQCFAQQQVRFLLQRRDMITRHQFALHLIADSTVIPNYLSLSLSLIHI